ncbi:MAG TPA: organomercurial lyase [Polyangiaceae bacterium]|nr:organomercurial lyase [Polyangiaceae bacterium]
MTERELELRRAIMTSFAATGAAPETPDEPALRVLADRHVIVLDEGADGPRIHMAHPFAGHRDGARVDADGRTWWGSCAWDGFGIVAALGLTSATVAANGIAVEVSDGEVHGEAVFHVAVPARAWWVDIGFT